ncbi:MAG: NAD(P)H-dependent oxidoreductase subunit E [Oligoflexales bacterium]|nr:NAD(P)H-dependent oxidoreductase subunit E [Oligoflexales bacterium]
MSVFSKRLNEKIEHFLTRYETKRSSILPVLHEIQDECGWIQEKHIEALEKEHGLARIHVMEVATFYSMYRLEESKPFRILFCDNIVCNMMGAKESMRVIRQKIQTLEKEGKPCPFSLQGVPCLGVCDGAPAMLVNKERHLKVSSDRVETILAAYTQTE